MPVATWILIAVISSPSLDPIQAEPLQSDVLIKLEEIPVFMAFSPDGKRVAVSTGKRKEKGTIRLYDASSAGVLSLIAGLEKPVRFISFSPDGKNLATTGDDKTLRIWNLESNPPSEMAKAEVYLRAPVAFSPDGKMLVSCTSSEFAGAIYIQTVQVWDWKERKLIPRGSFKNESLVAAFGFSPDAKTLIVGNVNPALGQGLIRSWDISGENPKALTTVEHQDRVHSVAFSADGKRAALGWGNGGAGGVKLWDLGRSPPAETASLTLRDWVTCVAFSPTGKMLAAGGGGSFEVNPTTVWDLRGPEPQELYSAVAGPLVLQVAFSPDGLRFASTEVTRTAGQYEGRVRIIQLPEKKKD